jgi:hypothetical protein
MRSVCQEYINSGRNTAGQFLSASGQVVPQQIWDIASAFISLQDARYLADYDTAATLTYVRADTEVMRAEVAFLDWASVQADPAAETFLAELLCRGIPRR